MQDLKHLIFFEDLLQTADNALIEQAKREGGVCVAYTCENVPEPLLNLGNAFSVRLFAPNTGSLDIATYYMRRFCARPAARCSNARSRAASTSPTASFRRTAAP